MKICAVILFIVFLVCSSSATHVFAQEKVTPTPTKTSEVPTETGSNILNAFISGFDWISSGLIFYTPSLMDSTIKMQDGTELTGMSNFRSIFYDVAVPLFVLITSFVAIRHISNDNAVQLQQFFKRLILIVVLFILTPAILSYSIQFTNLLNEKIIASNSYNLSTLINDFLGGFVQIPIFKQLFGTSLALPSWNTILQTIILVISIGFLLIGFIYIVFQAVIRFIALLILSVIFPVVLPFALSEKTENMVNTYFRTWFSFLIQQPAFVLGFAIVSAILTSISQAHNNSIGTLFVYSGALIFLGGINVFIGRIFGDGWSLLATNMQSMVIARNVNNGAGGIARNEKVKRIPSYAGSAIGNTAGFITNKAQQLFGHKQNSQEGRNETKEKLTKIRKRLLEQTSSSTPSQSDSKSKNGITNQTNAVTNNTSRDDNHTPAKQPNKDDNKTNPLNTQQKPRAKFSPVTTRRETTLNPIKVKRPAFIRDTRKETVPKRIPRRKVSI